MKIKLAVPFDFVVPEHFDDLGPCLTTHLFRALGRGEPGSVYSRLRGVIAPTGVCLVDMMRFRDGSCGLDCGNTHQHDFEIVDSTVGLPGYLGISCDDLGELLQRGDSDGVLRFTHISGRPIHEIDERVPLEEVRARLTAAGLPVVSTSDGLGVPWSWSEKELQRLVMTLQPVWKRLVDQWDNRDPDYDEHPDERFS